MAKILLFDEKSVKNRNRVRKHRQNKYMKKLHNDKINERIKKNFQKISFDRTTDFEDLYSNKQYNSHDYDEQNEFKDNLRIWALNHRITRKAVSDLLMILISAGFGFLPKDSRTLMSTPVNVPITNMTNGKMWYNGIHKCLEYVLKNVQCSMKITLDFNVDGMPISNSSSQQFWPILSAIRGIRCIFKLNFNNCNQLLMF